MLKIALKLAPSKTTKLQVVKTMKARKFLKIMSM
jgi:hypothetical protein